MVAWLTAGAIFFILWWLVLFMVLPISLRTQDEEEDVTLGTVRSAPRGPHVLRAIWRTTLATILVFAAGYLAIYWLDLSFSDFPIIIPE